MRFDRPRVLRVLSRLAADLDELTRGSTEADGNLSDDPRVHHRHLLAEPKPQTKRVTLRENRAALRAMLGVPPEERI